MASLSSYEIKVWKKCRLDQHVYHLTVVCHLKHGSMLRAFGHPVATCCLLSPGQMESQVDARCKLGFTCDSIWPGLVCTCVDLRWLALTLVDIKFARKSKQVFSLFGHPTGVNTSWVTSINLLLANEIEDSRLEIYFFVTSVYLRGNLRVRLATRPKSLRKFNLRPLATTCRFVWPGLYSFGQVRATMLRSGMLTSWILNTRHVATHHNRVAKRAQHVAPNNVVAFKFCDRLAGACKCWANNVGICCAEMLRSFDRGLTVEIKLWKVINEQYCK